MKIVILNKSDSTGGAAVVSFRLMQALREAGADARMLVAEKATDSPFVEKAAPEWLIKEKFFKERLDIFFHNGFNRETLFKIDTASEGLPLWRHPLVDKADAIILNWVNQGFLSLKGLRKLLGLEKPVVWTMHDLWNMTGICHHPYSCKRFEKKCGNCPLLGALAKPTDLSHKTWLLKDTIYNLPEGRNLKFVAVSNWLAGKAAESGLLGNREISVIPNPLPSFKEYQSIRDSKHEKGELSEDSSDSRGVTNGLRRETKSSSSPVNLLFGAARLDDPVKGFPVLIEATKILTEQFPETASRLRLITFGAIRNPALLEDIALPHEDIGFIKGEEEIRKIYARGDILVSASSYETLPTTLVEAQIYGLVPVSFNRGGQSDIITHGKTGYLAAISDNSNSHSLREDALNLARGIDWAVKKLSDSSFPDFVEKMRETAIKKFSPETVASSYLELIESISR